MKVTDNSKDLAGYGSYSFSESVPVRYSCGVLVIGAGPSGIAAAVSAARAGQTVVLCERYAFAGGMLTLGQISPILGSVCPGTFADEFISLLREEEGGCPEYRTRNGREIPADRETAKRVTDRLIRSEKNITFLGSTAFVSVMKRGGHVCGGIFSSQSGLFGVESKITVDCTGDGCAAAAAGAEYSVGRESDGGIQPMSLEFTLTGVDESRAITAWGGSDPVKIPSGPYAGMEYRELCKAKNREGELPRNVTIVRLHGGTRPGERSVNATQTNGRDPLDPESLTEAGSDLIPQIAACHDFLRKYIPGFENSVITSSSDAIGVRESRRIHGIDAVTDEDVGTGRARPDAAVHSAWFLIDIHNPAGGGQAEGFAHEAKPYDIPYGALVPAGVPDMLVAGRCISGTHRAHASYRVMVICMATGEAAGAAAALCAASGRQPSELPPEELRSLLRKRGVEM